MIPASYHPYYPPQDMLEKARLKECFITVLRANYDNVLITDFERWLWKKGIPMQNCYGYFPINVDQAAEMIYWFRTIDKDKVDDYPSPQLRFYV